MAVLFRLILADLDFELKGFPGIQGNFCALALVYPIRYSVSAFGMALGEIDYMGQTKSQSTP